LGGGVYSDSTAVFRSNAGAFIHFEGRGL